MKIINECKNRYAKPEDFKIGDFVLDSDGKYFRIILNENQAPALYKLDAGYIFSSNDSIVDLLTVDCHAPLIRIKSDDAELYMKN